MDIATVESQKRSVKFVGCLIFCTNVWIAPLPGVKTKRGWAFVTTCADTPDLGANLWVSGTLIGASLSKTALHMHVCIYACLFGPTTYLSTFKYFTIECWRTLTCISAKPWEQAWRITARLLGRRERVQVECVGSTHGNLLSDKTMVWVWRSRDTASCKRQLNVQWRGLLQVSASDDSSYI